MIFDAKFQLLKTSLENFLALTLTSLLFWIMSSGSSSVILHFYQITICSTIGAIKVPFLDWKFLVPSSVSMMVSKVEGCIVLMVTLVVSCATWVLLVATSTTMESTSIVVSIPSFAPPILIVPNLILDLILVGKGATKISSKKSGKVWA